MRLAHVMGPMTLVYHRRSGVTHMLSEPAPQILEALDAIGPADADAVARWLGARFDLESEDGSAIVAIVARLEELAGLGLVMREAA